MVEKEMENAILTAQKSEITEHFVYQKLSKSAMDPHNKSVLKQISDDELKHYDFWKKYTRQDAKPNRLSLSIHPLLPLTIMILCQPHNNECHYSIEAGPLTIFLIRQWGPFIRTWPR